MWHILLKSLTFKTFCFRNSIKGKCLRCPCKEDKDCPGKLTCQQDFISKFCSGYLFLFFSDFIYSNHRLNIHTLNHPQYDESLNVF